MLIISFIIIILLSCISSIIEFKRCLFIFWKYLFAFGFLWKTLTLTFQNCNGPISWASRSRRVTRPETRLGYANMVRICIHCVDRSRVYTPLGLAFDLGYLGDLTSKIFPAHGQWKSCRCPQPYSITSTIHILLQILHAVVHVLLQILHLLYMFYCTYFMPNFNNVAHVCIRNTSPCNALLY